MWDGLTNCHNTHTQSPNNLPYSTACSFQYYPPVNVWCSLVHDQLTVPLVLTGHLAADYYYLHFLQDDLPLPLEDIPLQDRLHMWLKQQCSNYFWSTSYTVLQLVLWKSLDKSWRSTCLATPFTRLDTVRYLLARINEGLGNQATLQTWDKVIQCNTDSAAFIYNNHKIIWKATHAVSKWACLCIANEGGNCEQ
jgi:hypothetical protein